MWHVLISYQINGSRLPFSCVCRNPALNYKQLTNFTGQDIPHVHFIFEQFLKIMKSISTVLFLSVVVFVVSSANTCKEEKPAEAADDARTTSLLWEISGNGLSAPSYLYGTMHLIDKKDFYVRPFIDSMLIQSEQVAFEIKLDDMAALMKMQALMILPEGKTLESMMPAEDYEKLKKYLSDSLNTNIDLIKDQKPLYIMQLLAEKMIKGETESFEIHFFMLCMQHQKPISGLETVEEQMGIFDAIPYDEQMKWLMMEVNDPGLYDSVFTDMVQAYKKEDIEQLAALMKESSPELMLYEDIFLTNRNKNWIPKIEELIKTKTTFIAVGAGHLPGENGVIELLRKKGYTVKPV